MSHYSRCKDEETKAQRQKEMFRSLQKERRLLATWRVKHRATPHQSCTPFHYAPSIKKSQLGFKKKKSLAHNFWEQFGQLVQAKKRWELRNHLLLPVVLILWELLLQAHQDQMAQRRNFWSFSVISLLGTQRPRTDRRRALAGRGWARPGRRPLMSIMHHSSSAEMCDIPLRALWSRLCGASRMCGGDTGTHVGRCAQGTGPPMRGPL